ncbi:leucine-rich repeat and IQ domain-containing protein 3-like isoform X2 [Littorina saxatilis]|uniref:Leucine-rich repeat and IQ domain-containing protein 3 n=1 Tax=Littorina saxatilis TaxID=31220 RepID=A0AAN9AYB4_9CAEN
MVSVPDWSKFSRTSDSGQKTDSTALLNKYYKQRELEAIKQAEQTGYFLEPSEEYLLKNVGPYSGTTKDLSKMFVVRLTGLHLRKLGDIPLCSSLQICILANNFLTKIDALSSCQQLVKLDLHGNQLTSIPGQSFWSALRKLRAIYLHDNPLGKFETLQRLSGAPVLAIVTLFDTPLYLKKNYRHHVVNSVWTLKALDHHVVSDEEIIEDASFEGTFSALSRSFRLDLCPPSPPGATYRQEVLHFHQLEAQINKILARHSPVIIVQRYVRGYFARKRLGLVPPRRHQSYCRSQDVLMMPPVSSKPCSSASSRFMPSISGVPRFSGAVSESGAVPPPSPMPAGLNADMFTATDMPGEPGGRRQNIYINLAKLQTGTLQTLHNEAEKMDAGYPPTARSELASRERKKKKNKDKRKCKNIRSVRQFFGPVVDTEPDDDDKDIEEDDELPITQYRLRGRQPTVMLSDATAQMILSRVEAGVQVREAKAERVQTARSEPPPKVTPFNFRSNDQRLFARVHGTMGLSCLFAVQKAYRDREKAEKATAKMEYIMAMREERQRAKERIYMYQDEKRNQAIRKSDQDRARILDQMEKRELLRLKYLDKQQELKSRVNDISKSLQADNTFTVEFNTQQTSVSKALLRHNRQARFEGRLSTRKDKEKKLTLPVIITVINPKPPGEL